VLSLKEPRVSREVVHTLEALLCDHAPLEESSQVLVQVHRPAHLGGGVADSDHVVSGDSQSGHLPGPGPPAGAAPGRPGRPAVPPQVRTPTVKAMMMMVMMMTTKVSVSDWLSGSCRILNKFLDQYQEDLLPWHESIEPCLSSMTAFLSDREVGPDRGGSRPGGSSVSANPPDCWSRWSSCWCASCSAWRP